MNANDEILWWGYLHAAGSIQLKRWFGDVKDYTTDCEGNDFVVHVVPPFPAHNREQALRIIQEKLREANERHGTT